VNDILRIAAPRRSRRLNVQVSRILDAATSDNAILSSFAIFINIVFGNNYFSVLAKTDNSRCSLRPPAMVSLGMESGALDVIPLYGRVPSLCHPAMWAGDPHVIPRW
jgi:hypothetical protein